MILRDYQQTATRDLREAFRAGARSVILYSPTGSGKTVLAADIVSHAVAKNSRVLFVGDSTEIIDQTSATLTECSVPHGIIQGRRGNRKPWELVHVATIQTLRHRELPPEDLVIIDECHLARAATWEKVIRHYYEAGARLIGLSATPCRLDGRGLGKLFDRIVYGPSVIDLTDQGWLVQTRIFAPPGPDLRGVHNQAGDFQKKELAAACDKRRLVGDIIAHWLKHAKGRLTAVSATSIVHSQHIRDEFRGAGIPSEHVDGTTPKGERKRLLRGLAAGEFQVLCQVDICSKGWDCLDAETEVLTGLGWKRQGEVTRDDCVYSLNTQSGFTELVPVQDVASRPRRPDEKMVHFGGQRISVRVTEGHATWVRTATVGGYRSNLQAMTALELASRRGQAKIPLSAEMEAFPGLPLRDDEIRLVAWFMTDGGFQSTTRLVISQSKHHWTEIDDLLRRLGLTYYHREVKRTHNPFGGRPLGRKPGDNLLPLHVFEVPKGVHRKLNGWQKYLPYLDKNVSRLLHNMTRRQFQVFWEEALKGDGERSAPNRTGWLWCDRKEQADAYTQMAVLRGFACSYSTRTLKSGQVMYRLAVRDARELTLSPYAEGCLSKRRNDPVEYVYTPETVWCVTNRNGTLITRRKGKVIILGNCKPISCLVDARPTQSLARWLQFVGRGLRISPETGKQDCVLLDHAGNVRRFGMPDEEREWSLTGAEGIRKKATDSVEAVRMCKKCWMAFRSSQQVCPNCGWRYAGRLSEIEHEAGELQEIERQRKLLAIEHWREKTDNDERRKYYESWIGIARERGYKPNWADVKFKAIFGSWPPEEWRMAAVAVNQ